MCPFQPTETRHRSSSSGENVLCLPVGACSLLLLLLHSRPSRRPSGGSICLLLLMLMLPHHARSGLTGPTL